VIVTLKHLYSCHFLFLPLLIERQRLKEATESLALKQAALKEAQLALEIVTAKLAALQVSYDTSVHEKNQLREEAERLEAKLDRADKLVSGLAGEYVRWQASIGQYNAALVKVYGDSLIAAAFLSYAGPFETSYRATLMSAWAGSVAQQQLPISDHYNFTAFLARAQRMCATGTYRACRRTTSRRRTA
jgi:dynein heavy chain